jgi:chitin-binding protein
MKWSPFMRSRISLPLLTVAAVVTSLFVAVPPASAHGYVSAPPSRQANCASGAVSGCGDLIYEPQSVEAPKGSTACNGDGTRFAVLNDNSKNWPAADVGTTATFSWRLTARHSTDRWEYFIGASQLAQFVDNNARPDATKTHSVSMGGFRGRQTVLARWTIADTTNAFYSCVDVNIGGGGGNPQPPTTSPPNPPPTTDPPAPAPTTSPPAPPTGDTWRAGFTYAVGTQVTYGGATYRCLQAHTSMVGWEPPNTPALWQV